MGKEIEHKYIVISNDYESMAVEKHEIRQGYLSRDPERTVRVRLFDDKAYITIKGLTAGDTRAEFEYEIPLADGEAILGMCSGRIVSKTRFIVPFAGNVWEVDSFHGDLAPMKVAEIELEESTHDYERPPFVGDEVTGDPRYYNSNL